MMQMLSVVDPRFILMVLLGSVAGLFVGAIPGLSVSMATALLVSITYTWEHSDALAMIMGVYVVGVFSGAVSAILITPIRMKVSRKVLLCLGNSASLKLTIIHMNPRTKQLITVKEKNRDPAYQVPLFQILNGHAAFRRQRCYV